MKRKRNPVSTIHPTLEAKVRADQDALVELESLAAEGLASGHPIDVGPDYWEKKHRQLDERLKRTKSW